jgi:three-Cys-motif partner protein
MDPQRYKGREQTGLKHFVLQNYLQVLAFKVGQHRPGTTLNFVDGFSGPWQSAAEDQSDSSPAIAMNELDQVCRDLAALPKSVKMTARCLFVEKEAQAFAKLQALCIARPSVATKTIHGLFEDHISDAVTFATAGANPFAFVFIDPTGWTGYSLTAIEPLLRVRPSEVLINFMLKDILRFIDDETPSTVASFEGLFGQEAGTYRTRWKGLAGLDRQDAIVEAYQRRIRDAGQFQYCVSTFVLHPTQDRAHFHLVYATRSRAGLVTFRATERKALEKQKELRASAKQTKRSSGGQGELFEPQTLDTPYIDELRDRYTERARRALLDVLGTSGAQVPYERLLEAALQWPTVSETDLKKCLDAWRKTGAVEFFGLGKNERSLKLDANHRVKRTSVSPPSWSR